MSMATSMAETADETLCMQFRTKALHANSNQNVNFFGVIITAKRGKKSLPDCVYKIMNQIVNQMEFDNARKSQSKACRVSSVRMDSVC